MSPFRPTGVRSSTRARHAAVISLLLLASAAPANPASDREETASGGDPPPVRLGHPAGEGEAALDEFAKKKVTDEAAALLVELRQSNAELRKTVANPRKHATTQRFVNEAKGPARETHQHVSGLTKTVQAERSAGQRVAAAHDTHIVALVKPIM